MSVRARSIEEGEVLCVGGQIGECMKVTKDRKSLRFRPFGGSRVRLIKVPTAGYISLRNEYLVRVERYKQWVGVTR